MGLLELKDVSYKYEGAEKLVFEHANLSFDAGKVYAIVGKSGAGKSTLLALLSGLDLPTAGRVEFGGQSLADINRDNFRAKQAGIIFQSLNLLTNATAIDNIVLSMQISGVDIKDKKARALELLKKVGISPEKADRKILKLSGGEQQRIGIARALAHDPPLIAADEPTGSLDRDIEAKILRVFKSLARDEGKCVIIVTHSRKVAAVADEVWSLENGAFRLLPNKKS